MDSLLGYEVGYKSAWDASNDYLIDSFPGAPENTTDYAELARRADRRAAEEYFYDFVKQAWPHIDPREFQDNWHIEETCLLLQQVTEGLYQNALINIPPGFAKSLIVSVMWPAWEWIHDPGRRYLASSHGSNISVRDTGRCRDIVKSEWYQENWGRDVAIPYGEDAKTRFKLTAGGYRISTSRGGGVTGERGDTIIYDDPHKLADAYSPNNIAIAIRHWSEELKTRGVGEETRYVVVMQRVAQRDVSQVIFETEAASGLNFEKLILPMRYDPQWRIQVRGGPDITPSMRDKRHREYLDGKDTAGELLFEAMYPEHTVRSMETDLENRAQAILNQKPQEGLGSAFKRKDILSSYRVKKDGVWWYVLLDDEGGHRFYREERVWKMMSVDFATSLAQTADFTSIGVYAVTQDDDDLILIDHIHERMAGPDVIPTVWNLFRLHQPSYVLMEKAGFQLSEIQRAFRQGLPVIPMRPDGKDKFMRSLPAQTRVRRHKFFIDEDLPDRHEVIEEVVNFPDPNRHDDIVDQISYAAQALTEDLEAISIATQEELANSVGYETMAGPFGPGYNQF